MIDPKRAHKILNLTLIVCAILLLIRAFVDQSVASGITTAIIAMLTPAALYAGAAMVQQCFLTPPRHQEVEMVPLPSVTLPEHNTNVAAG